MIRFLPFIDINRNLAERWLMKRGWKGERPPNMPFMPLTIWTHERYPREFSIQEAVEMELTTDG